MRMSKRAIKFLKFILDILENLQENWSRILRRSAQLQWKNRDFFTPFQVLPRFSLYLRRSSTGIWQILEDSWRFTLERPIGSLWKINAIFNVLHITRVDILTYHTDSIHWMCFDVMIPKFSTSKMLIVLDARWMHCNE